MCISVIIRLNIIIVNERIGYVDEIGKKYNIWQ